MWRKFSLASITTIDHRTMSKSNIPSQCPPSLYYALLTTPTTTRRPYGNREVRRENLMEEILEMAIKIVSERDDEDQTKSGASSNGHAASSKGQDSFNGDDPCNGDDLFFQSQR
jgi:hypothetical protein